LPPAKVYCPHCRTEATELLAFLFIQSSSVYCKNCGWNIGTATKTLRGEMWTTFLLSGVGVLLAVTAWIRGANGIKDALIIAVAFLALPLASGLVARYRLSKIGELPPGVSQQAAFAQPPGLPTPNGTDPVKDPALSMRPRQARLSMRGYVYVAAMTVVTALVMFLLYRCVQILAASSKSSIVWAMLLVLSWGAVLWQCISFFRNRIREKWLLTNGELSHGFVVNQSTTRNGSLIVYRYRESMGSAYQFRVTDFSNKLCDQMPIHVFYEPLDSRMSAALESSLYRIG